MAEPSQIAFRTLKGIGILDAAPVYSPPAGFERPEGNLRCSAYSSDGKYFAWASPEGVTVIEPTIGHVVSTIPADNVYELGFSPLGTYIITWQRPTKDETGDANKNLKVWRTVESTTESDQTKPVVAQFVQKSQTGWNLQYTSDEKFCARAVSNEVQFYESENLRTVWNRLREEGVGEFAIAPGKDHSVAVFVPERKGQPAAVKVYKVPQFEAPVSQKTFFKGDKVQLKWNELGTSLIVLASTDVDKSNRSYYGETNMYILSANGGFDSRIQLDKEGPIHDVTWSPSSKEFGVVYGYMPAKTTIFNTKAEATHNFNLGPRNTILFSPHGRFVLVAGFGNLAGQIDIYDLQKDYAKVATIEASNASVCQWSPDGKHILTATTSPRLRVDNGVRIWHVGGGLMYNEEMNELYDVNWRPQSTDKHPLGDPLNPVPTPHASALTYLGTQKTPSKPAGAYRPPGARGTSTPLHFKREDEGGAAYTNNGTSSSTLANGFGKSRRHVPGAEAVESAPLPPGAAPGGGVSLTLENGDESLSKAALKNRKKREAKKAKESAASQAGDTATLGPSADANKRDRSRNRSRNRGGSGDGFLTPDPKQKNIDGRSRSRNDKSRQYSPSPSRPRSQNRRRDDGRDGQKNGVNSTNADGAPSARQQQNQRPSSRSPRPPRNRRSHPTNTPTPLSTATAPSSSPIAATAPPPPSTTETVASPTTPSAGPGTPQEKKMRALHKKLRAIEELKMRQASGEKLELSQISKIKTEESVRKEVEQLEAK